MSQALNRVCPNCSKSTIPVSALIASNFCCPDCKAIIGVRRIYKIGFFVPIFVVTVLTSIGVMAQQGIYAALIWLPFPIAAIGYFKARLCPLVTKQERRDASGVTED